jgi:hypothetical protein
MGGSASMSHQQSSKNAARELLQSILSEEQWNRFNHAGTLELAAKAGIYRLSTNGPTKVLDSESRGVVAITRVPQTAISARDRVIAEYLLIRNDENLYWQTATITPEPAPSRRPLVFLLAAFDVMMLLILLARLH